jgi:NAD(P)-dependent dehydrogenase (short-subunit alcohol dehydrogenase family)
MADTAARHGCVSGPVWTALNPSDKSSKHTTQIGGGTPMKRPAQPQEIAPAYVFLASAQCFIGGDAAG